MKKKVLILIILAIGLSASINGQKILTLNECYDQAMKATALAGEKEAYSNVWKLKDDNLAKGWLPTLDANASATYNSDVVDLGSRLPSIQGLSSSFTPMPHDQYKLTLDINQLIYDGGAIRVARNIEKTELNINEKQTEIDLYKLRSQINSYYFGILMIKRQEELLKNYLDIIEKRIKSMESAVINGAVLKSDIDVLSSEKLKIEQQIREAAIRKNSLTKILSDITGNEIGTSTELSLPALKEETTDEIMRPELQLFDLRKEQLTASLGLIQSKRLPKAFGFATLGYGNPPGQNFLQNTFQTYYVVGGGIKWNIFDWNKAKNEKHLIALQQNVIENRKKDMSDNLKRLLESKYAEISSLNELIETDIKLITLRKNITASAESQYSNGIITATEYLNELNSEKQAAVNYEIHKINLAVAKVEYLNISGKEIK